MNSDTVSLMLGIPIGVMCSFLAWLIVTQGIRPTLRFEKLIDQVTDPRSAPLFSVGFINSGRRDAVDVVTHARLRLRGLVPGRPERWLVMEVPTNNRSIPVARPRRRGGVRHVLVLLPSAIAPADRARLPEQLSVSLDEGSISLLDLMRQASASELTLSAVCSDRFSGARHVFQSRAFRCEDLEISIGGS